MGERTSSDGLNLDETAATRAEIERTRAHMGQTLDHIGERLAPERFKAEAVEAADKLKEEAIDTAAHLKDAAVEAARAMTDEVIGGVKNATREVVDKARNRVAHTRYEIEGVTMPYVDTIRKNPVPAAMVGLGLYWLMQSFEENKRLHRRRRHARLHMEYGHAQTQSYNPYRVDNSGPSYIGETEGVMDRAHDMVSQTRDRLSETKQRLRSSAQESAHKIKQKAVRRLETVQESAHGAKDQFETVLYENPMIVAAAAGAIGLVVGMLLPDTELENETLGHTRDQLLTGAQEVIQEKTQTLKEKAINVARETAAVATDTLKDQAAKEGLTPTPAASTVGTTGTTLGSNPLDSQSTLMP